MKKNPQIKMLAHTNAFTPLLPGPLPASCHATKFSECLGGITDRNSGCKIQLQLKLSKKQAGNCNDRAHGNAQRRAG